MDTCASCASTENDTAHTNVAYCLGKRIFVMSQQVVTTLIQMSKSIFSAFRLFLFYHVRK